MVKKASKKDSLLALFSLFKDFSTFSCEIIYSHSFSKYVEN